MKIEYCMPDGKQAPYNYNFSGYIQLPVLTARNVSDLWTKAFNFTRKKKNGIIFWLIKLYLLPLRSNSKKYG